MAAVEKVNLTWWNSYNGRSLDEFLGASSARIDNSGALIITDDDKGSMIVIAPGDWHDLTVDKADQ